MSTTAVEPVRSPERERWAWLLFPLGLIAFAYGLLALLAGVSGVVQSVDAIGSTAAVQLPLQASSELSQRSGTYSYGGPHVPEHVSVRITGVEASVAGLDAPTRVALQAGPAAWALTAAVTAAAIGTALMRLRRRGPRSAAGPVLIAAASLAIGSTVAQLVSGYAATRLGRVDWIGPDGIDGFTGNGTTAFSLNPLGFAAALLVVALLIRRAEAADGAGRRPADAEADADADAETAR